MRAMHPTSAVLLVGGAPQLAIDAVRHISVAASGATALRLHALLAERGRNADLLLGPTAPAAIPDHAQRYRTRGELEHALAAWTAAHGDGTVVMSAAVNDYEIAGVTSQRDGSAIDHRPGDKIPSGAEAVHIRLRPATKLVDAMRRDWGFSGRLICFKYEDAATVIASARALGQRVAAEWVYANSLCGTVQALVSSAVVETYDDRAQALQALAVRIADGQES